MSERQIAELAGALTRHQHYFGAVPTEDRQWAIQNTEAAIGLFAEALKNRVGIEKKLLKFVGNRSLPAIAKFVAAEKFCEGKTVDGIKVGWLGDNFKANFLKKVENDVPALKAREHKLLVGSRDSAIITELGGEEKVETTLAHFWEFLKVADQNLWYVRHIRDVNGVLWAVDGYWDGGRLRVEADPLDDPGGWGAGGRFLSR